MTKSLRRLKVALLSFLIVCSNAIFSYAARAQNIDEVAQLFKSLTLKYPRALSLASTTALDWPILTDEPYYSAGLQLALSTTNIAKLLFSRDYAGKVLGEERMGLGLFPNFRFKQWNKPFDFGISVMPLYISESFSLIQTTADYQHRVLQSREATLFDNEFMLPDVVVGAIFSYSRLNFKYSLPGTVIEGIDQAESDTRIRIQDIQLDFGSNTYSILVRGQANYSLKNFLVYWGLEPGVLISQTKIRTDSRVEISRDAGKSYSPYSTFATLTEEFLREKNLLYDDLIVEPLVNLYAGFQYHMSDFSLNLKISLSPIDLVYATNLGFQYSW